jgi:hypothetical protein
MRYTQHIGHFTAEGVAQIEDAINALVATDPMRTGNAEVVATVDGCAYSVNLVTDRAWPREACMLLIIGALTAK